MQLRNNFYTIIIFEEPLVRQPNMRAWLYAVYALNRIFINTSVNIVCEIVSFTIWVLFETRQSYCIGYTMLELNRDPFFLLFINIMFYVFTIQCLYDKVLLIQYT